MSEKIVITGAAGLIGFSLCRELLKQNLDIVAIDNFNSYYDPDLKKKRYELLIQESKDRNIKNNFTFENLDLCDQSSLDSFLESESPSSQGCRIVSLSTSIRQVWHQRAQKRKALQQIFRSISFAAISS